MNWEIQSRQDRLLRGYMPRLSLNQIERISSRFNILDRTEIIQANDEFAFYQFSAVGRFLYHVERSWLINNGVPPEIEFAWDERGQNPEPGTASEFIQHSLEGVGVRLPKVALEIVYSKFRYLIDSCRDFVLSSPTNVDDYPWLRDEVKGLGDVSGT